MAMVLKDEGVEYDVDFAAEAIKYYAIKFGYEWSVNEVDDPDGERTYVTLSQGENGELIPEFTISISSLRTPEGIRKATPVDAHVGPFLGGMEWVDAIQWLSRETDYPLPDELEAYFSAEDRESRSLLLSKIESCLRKTFDIIYAISKGVDPALFVDPMEELRSAAKVSMELEDVSLDEIKSFIAQLGLLDDRDLNRLISPGDVHCEHVREPSALEEMYNQGLFEFEDGDEGAFEPRYKLYAGSRSDPRPIRFFEEKKGNSGLCFYLEDDHDRDHLVNDRDHLVNIQSRISEIQRRVNLTFRALSLGVFAIKNGIKISSNFMQPHEADEADKDLHDDMRMGF